MAPTTAWPIFELLLHGPCLTLRLKPQFDLIRVVTLHATVIASGSQAYLMGCGVASYYFKLSGQKRVQIMNINNSVDASLLRNVIIERYEGII